MSSTTTTAEEDPFAILGETLDTAADSLEAASTDARASAHRAAARTKRVIGSGAYSISYGLAYGTVFAATYLHDLMPVGSAVQRGFADGAHDALEARRLRQLLQDGAHAEVDHARMPETDDEVANEDGHAAPTESAKRANINRKTRHTVERRADGFEKKL